MGAELNGLLRMQMEHSESTIVTQGEEPPEKFNDSGKWTVLDGRAARYELSWDARHGGFVTRNYVTLSADGQRLIENDKGKEIDRGIPVLRCATVVVPR